MVSQIKKEPSFVEAVENVNQRTPCMLVVDASGSMETPTRDGATRIDQLNRGLATLEQELKNDPTARVRVQLAMVSVGGPAGGAEKMLDWTDACDFAAFPLNAGGETPLAKGLLLALNEVRLQKEWYKTNGISYTRPWIVVLTDGEPTDPPDTWHAAANACREAEHQKKCVIYPIGVEGVNATTLQQISKTPVRPLNELRYVELFQWLSRSLSATSRSVSGELVQLAPTDPWVAVKL